MTRKQRYREVLDYFQTHNPSPETELVFTTPFELLIAVILSAQCTDVRINKVTPRLFLHYPDAFAMSKASPEEIFELISSVSYPNSKAKYLVETSKLLVNQYNGDVPLEINELIKLPGVGRKTANVVTSVIDNQPNMAVDTHVFRVSHRLGLVSAKATTPLAVEKTLTTNIPEELIHKAHHWLILHGRYICKSKNPFCFNCGLSDICNYKKNAN